MTKKHMRTRIVILFCAISTCVWSQTKIEGSVIDHNGEPVALANIFLKDTYDGTSSDEKGDFSFQTSEKGEYILIAKLVGYNEFQQLITLDGTPVNVPIRLKESINELDAVTISAGSFTAGDASRRTVFRAVDIATTAGATADIAGALNTLPGTQKVGESGRLFVRGGDGEEARTFIDGMVVLNAYNPAAPNTPSRGRYLPFMFKGTSFSTGGYSAEFGQALSSTLALDSKDETETSRTDLSILSVGGDIAHTRAWEGGSMAGKIQYTNLRPYMGLVNQRIDWKSAPVEFESIAAFRQKVGSHGMAKAFGNFSRSDFSFYRHDIDDFNKKELYSLFNDYRYANGFYKNILNDRWMMRGGLSYSYIQNDIAVGERKISDVEKGIHAKTVFEGSVSDHVELKTGAEIIHRRNDYFMTFISGARTESGFNEVITSLFVEADLYASNRFVTRIGGRSEHNNMTGKFRADPRISLAYKTGDNAQVSFAYGTFSQSPKNEFLRQDHGLGQEKAEHVILNYQRIENDRTFRIETYYKLYRNLTKIDAENVITGNGSGYARGVEVFWRDNASVDNLDYWLSYSLLDTKRDYLRFPYKSVPSFASSHNFSAVAKYFVQKIKSQLGATWSFASGRPFNDPNTAVFNGGRTPSYQDLSFNWSYLPKPYLILYLSCTNLLGRDNIFGYEYSANLSENGLYNSRPIRQPAPRFLFLGILITLSKDKSISQLPTL
jgi:hypothetical protein